MGGNTFDGKTPSNSRIRKCAFEKIRYRWLLDNVPLMVANTLINLVGSLAGKSKLAVDNLCHSIKDIGLWGIFFMSDLLKYGARCLTYRTSGCFCTDSEVDRAKNLRITNMLLQLTPICESLATRSCATTTGFRCRSWSISIDRRVAREQIRQHIPCVPVQWLVKLLQNEVTGRTERPPWSRRTFLERQSFSFHPQQTQLIRTPAVDGRNLRE
ncbi:uncharacterized protein LOC119768075 [Culex quinquefasciatus]|uniref:uncharacterized protein LOC119768075 n=1 Tax=Culex quinquefasciatus TaxID=7176 RepID=UPI0018E2A6D9|nr:uncharacterized protein LOC119768075 [Culex quinquefasciatus]